MNSFQIIVLSIFVILAILILTGFAIMLNSKKDADSEYPSSYSTCPDYWDVSGNLCISNSTTINRGSNWLNINYTPGYYNDSNHPGANFNDPSWNDIIYPGVSGRCSLKKWATDTGIVWDGVTNYNSAYC
jgi:hypothetical protein